MKFLSKKVFVREATGLVKNASFMDTVALNICNMSLGSVLGIVGFTLIALPPLGGINLVYSSILAFALSIPQVIVYTMMTQRFPRSGGDYVWLSRNFGGFLGSSLSFMGEDLGVLSFLAIISLSAVFAIGSVGLSLGYENMLPLAVPGESPLVQFGIAASIFIVLILLNILNPKAGYRLVSVFAIIGIIALGVAMATLLSAGNAGVIDYMNTLNSIGANATYTSVAASYTGSSSDLNGIIFLIPFFAIFVYPYINGGPAIASEIKGKSAIKWNVPISSLIVFVTMTATFATMYYVGGFNFINGAFTNPNLVVNWSLNFWTLAMGVTSNVELQWFIGLGWIIWTIGIIAQGIIVFSRYIFAQSFDRFLPGRLSYVHPRWGSPVIIHLIDLVITIGLIAGASFYYGTISSLYGVTIGALVYFAVVGLSAAYYGIRKESGNAKAILVVFGIAEAAAFAYLAYLFLAYPTVWGGNWLAYGYTVASLVAGAIIYICSKQYHKRKGIDISLAFEEIPPE